MANPTTNFGWVMPTATDLVTDLPADFDVFGQAVDTSLAQLKGGTTGQVLSKTSATNMAFTWVTPTDQTPLTTKGDLFTFTTVDARLGVGANGTVLTADSAEATGIKWAAAGSASALVYVGGTTFTTSSAVNVNNVFSATYANYMVVADFVGSAATAGMTLRLRVAGADNTTSNYNTQALSASSTSVAGSRSTAQTSMQFTDSSTSPNFCQVSVINPFATANTLVGGYGIFNGGTGIEVQNKMGTFTATTSFTGFSIIPSSGTVTGTLRVYGLVNS